MNKKIFWIMVILSGIFSLGVIVYSILIWINNWDYSIHLVIIVIAIVIIQALEFLFNHQKEKDNK